MALNTGISATVGQHQQAVLTPRIQYAIRIQQLSSAELKQEIQSALDVNPLLESDDETMEYESESADEYDDDDTEQFEDSVDPFDYDEMMASDPAREESSTESSSDVDWDDVYIPANPSSDVAPSQSRDEIPSVSETTLCEHLLDQLYLLPLDESPMEIARHLVYALSDDGFLREPMDEVVSRLGDRAINDEDIEQALKVVQSLEPTGVGARSIPECLSLQIADLDESEPAVRHASLIVSKYLDLVAQKDFQRIAEVANLSADNVEAAVAVILSLNPYPALPFQPSADYVVPDVIVRKSGSSWFVELNPDLLPRIRLNASYADLAESVREGEGSYLRDRLNEARNLLRAVRIRNETLMKVATSIVHRQQGFFESGEKSIKPLSLADVAADIEMHESTVSRATTHKYMSTPHGIRELKYFFARRIDQRSGRVVSSTAIRAWIKEFTEKEDLTSPLSDDQIAKMLHEMGMRISRRTVAKYRMAMSIPSSSERRLRSSRGHGSGRAEESNHDRRIRA